MAAPRGGSERSCAPRTNRERIGTNHAIADTLHKLVRRNAHAHGHLVWLCAWGGGVVHHISVDCDSQAPSPEGDARSETCPWGRSAMKRAASTAAAAPRWTWVCASCAAANLPFHEGPDMTSLAEDWASVGRFRYSLSHWDQPGA